MRLDQDLDEFISGLVSNLDQFEQIFNVEEYRIKVQGQRTTTPDYNTTTARTTRDPGHKAFDDPFYVDEVVTVFD